MVHSLLSMTSHQPSHGQGSHQTSGQEEHLVNALHAALNNLSTSDGQAQTESPIYSPSQAATVKEKAHMGLDILVPNDTLVLRGTGVDVEPTLLTGNVVLTLTEPTTIRQITLMFRGKARVPSNPTDPHVINNSPQQYIVCSHEWTFLEGFKKHNHTLKAGKHFFPFELRLGGALPSTLATYVNGGASISYKLRATAVRPGLSANLTTVLPITLLRTFSTEALEYQQTLEIENTWPEKVMYALMIPHKAWAAGDELSVLLKFAPLSKGVRVISVTTQLCETTKTLARGGHLEKSRNVITRKHEIVDGKAIEDSQLRKMMRKTFQINSEEPAPAHSGASSPGYPPGGAFSGFISGTTTPIHENSISSGFATASESTNGSVTNDLPDSSSPNAPVLDDDGTFDSEVTTTIKMNLPATLTPSHSLDPIIVQYRIRWSVLLANLDGHTSELRCSLPIHILDLALLDEARAATRVTRRLLFGWEEEHANEEDDIVLPSYPSHVRDRIAMTTDMAAAADDTSTMPQVNLSGVTTPATDIPPPASTEMPMSPQSPPQPQPSGSHSGPSSFIASSMPTFHLGRKRSNSSSGNSPPQHASSAESSRPASRHERLLDSVNDTLNSITTRGNDRHSTSGGWRSLVSRAGSRANSRAPSPERHREREGHSHSHSQPHASLAIPPGDTSADDINQVHIHASNAASRQPHGLFSVVMKPVPTTMTLPWHSSSHSSALAAHFQHAHAFPAMQAQQAGGGGFGHGSRANSTGDLRGLVLSAGTPLHGYSYSTGYGSLQTPGGGLYNHTIPPTPDTGLTTSQSAAAVPDYFASNHAGGGVVPPLPTYEDSEAQAHAGQTQSNLAPGAGTTGPGRNEEDIQRSMSDSNLVGRLATPVR